MSFCQDLRTKVKITGITTQPHNIRSLYVNPLDLRPEEIPKTHNVTVV